ncbi:MAG: cytochrome c3 family protein [Nitrospirae bacterium]|nr:cytochrome c3 family protein [Nitrospirota bacterium]
MRITKHYLIPGKTYLHIPLFSALLFLFVLLALVPPAFSQEIDCLMCHEQLAKEKVVHEAVQMGCPTCHTGIDAKDVPHKKTNKLVKGLSAEQPDLCFGCHDKSKFQKKNVHAAIGMGCTGCHNPHSSKNPKLLVAELPDLCFNCHDKKGYMGKKAVHPPVLGGMCTSCHNPHSSDMAKLLFSEPPDLCYTCHDREKFNNRMIHAPVGIGMCNNCHTPHQSDNEKLLVSQAPDLCYNCHDKAAFSKKNVHVPVSGGLCLSCHRPHASGEISLLSKDPINLCFECHASVRKAPHAIVGFSAAGHPLGMFKKGKKALDDPARPGKRFYCGSCHNPHSSDSPSLFRYETKSSMGLCTYCHKM